MPFDYVCGQESTRKTVLEREKLWVLSLVQEILKDVGNTFCLSKSSGWLKAVKYHQFTLNIRCDSYTTHYLLKIFGSSAN